MQMQFILRSDRSPPASAEEIVLRKASEATSAPAVPGDALAPLLEREAAANSRDWGSSLPPAPLGHPEDATAPLLGLHLFSHPRS